MKKLARVGQVLAFSLLLSHSSVVSSQTVSIDKNKALQIIGVATAIGGIIILSRGNSSTLLGLALLIAGTATALCSEEIVKKSPKFCKKTCKAANNIYYRLQKYFCNEPKHEGSLCID